MGEEGVVEVLVMRGDEGGIRFRYLHLDFAGGADKSFGLLYVDS